MALRRYGGKRRFTSRRKTSRNSRAYPTRRTTRKRTYRKKASPRRSMIDKMSRKKRDTMLSVATTGKNPNPSSAFSANQIVLGAATTSTTFLPGVHTMVFCPTARFLTPNNGAFTAMRTSTSIFVKGLAETYTYLPNDSSVWWHRRIVFASKHVYAEDVSTIASGAIDAQDATNTPTYRKFRDMSSDPGSTGYSTLATNLVTDIFKGILTTDWLDPIRAPLDRTRITVLSDRLLQLSSGNDTARPRVIRHYTPVSKSIVYQDEENGTNMTVSQYSTDAKPGLGNIYVMDFVECPVPLGTTTSTITIGSNQTLYWHEKH